MQRKINKNNAHLDRSRRHHDCQHLRGATQETFFNELAELTEANKALHFFADQVPFKPLDDSV